MPRAEIIPTGELGDGYSAPTCTAIGSARSELIDPECVPLWLVSATVSAGAMLTWTAEHGEEGIFVVAGEVRTAGTKVGRDGAVVVEAGQPAVVEALTDVELRHFGSTEVTPPADGPFGPPLSGGVGVHAVNLQDVTIRPGRTSIRTVRYADSRCPSCRISLFTVGSDEGHRGASHFHSQDEIIHVLDGALIVAGTRAEPGTTLAVPANVRYRFEAPGPFRFVNYRRDASMYTAEPGSAPRLEG